MDELGEFGGTRFEDIAKTVRRKRSQTSRRPKPESQPPLSSTPSDEYDTVKVSSDENTAYDGNSERKVFNLNQYASKGSSATRVEGEHYSHKMMEDGGSSMLYSGGSPEEGIEQRRSGLNHKQLNEGVTAPRRHSGVVGDGVVNENKFKKLKLMVGGVTRTIQTKATSHAPSGSGPSMTSVRLAEAPRPRQKLILQDDSDEDNSPAPDKKFGLQGILWKDFSRGGFSIGKKESLMCKMPEKSASRKQGEKSDQVRKSKRVSKKHDLNGEFDDDDEDDEIRYLEKLRTSKVATGYRDVEEESSIKQRSLSRISMGGKYDNLKDFGPSRSGKDGKKSRSDRFSGDTDYKEEELMSDGEPEDKKKKKKPRKDSPDSPTESKREIGLTTRQRALLSGKDASSVSAANPIEFPNGLPPPPPRKQKDKLTEVEQQLKKAEAAERRRMQNEKAARESEAEAIRKILGQDSSRKKREDKLKKHQEELAQEMAANALTLPPNTVRCVTGPTGTTVTFSEDMGLPRIFDPKPFSYPPPREKCASPSCNNPYKYRDSKSMIPLCSLRCYKAFHENMQAGTAC